MNKEKENNITVLEFKKSEYKPTDETEKVVYQSNPIKTDLYSRLAAFRNSQRKFAIEDVIKDSLK